MNFTDPDWRRSWLGRLQTSASVRARKSGMRFDLRPGFASQLYEDQHGCCAVSGLRFNLERFAEALVKHPFAPSIDRKLSSGGYTEDNVRLVCVAVNFGMGQWGEEVFLTIARAAVAHEAKEQSGLSADDDGDWYARQRERIAAAEALSGKLSDSERIKQRGHIASLKRALTMGPDRLRLAASRARARREVNG